MFLSSPRAEKKSAFRRRVTLIATALALSACTRRAAPAITSITDELPAPTQAPHPAFAALADKVRPSVVVLATFDEHGRLIANQHGFFTSANGDLLAERTAMNNAASAIVKSADGRAYDIFGTYVRSAAPNFILLKTNAHDVPYLNSPAAVQVREGAPAAIVLSSVGNAQTSMIEGQITARKSEDAGEWLTFEPPPSKSALGAPVIDETGAIIGIVAQRNEASLPAVFRSTGETNPVVAQTEEVSPPGVSAAESSPAEIPISPAEGPDATTPSPPPNRTPAKTTGRRGRLIYTPAPRYPQSLAWTRWNMRRSGTYRLTFNAQGEATNVEVARSAGHPAMDKEAVSTLRSWRCEPGSQWSLVVPITFKQ